MRVLVRTDGTARGSGATISRKDGIETIEPASVVQASCSVRRQADGMRIITATIWVSPNHEEAR